MKLSDLVLEEEEVLVSFLDLSTLSCQKLTPMAGKILKLQKVPNSK